MFVGRYARQLDGKGRLAIPAPYLNRLGSDEREEIYVTPGENGCIWVVPRGFYDVMVGMVVESGDEEVGDLFFHYSQLRTIDRSGRVLLDEEARAFAGLPDPAADKVAVMVCGSGKYLQVWHKDDYLKRAGTPRTFAQSLRTIRKAAEASLR